MRTSQYSVKQTGFSVSLVPELYKMFVVMQPLINSPTRHYNNTGKHSPSLQLAFLTSVQQEGDLKYVCVVLNGMSTHCHTYRKYTWSHQSRDTSLLGTLGTNGVHIIEVYCITSYPHFQTATPTVLLNCSTKSDECRRRVDIETRVYRLQCTVTT